ncbi:hypothetical protein Pint_10474 [Pistacia integerrima]|uniref:Uncharacterized protein n=1 Tax=Pistacia integerrima TaxID=434235 RepID=A0ACC0XML8_9ROSI|nr:hypothetical protein Pint_10474 [Pistacia integerrima]
MQRLSSRISRAKLSSLTTPFTKTHCKHTFTTFLANPGLQKQQQQYAIPCDFLKWASLGFYRTSKFATGFTPLQPKPLDSIIDIQRAKDKSSEDLASIWDDYHIGRGHIGASMKAQLYHLLEHRARDCRYFVIPLWKGSGYTTMFAQGWSLITILCLTCAAYNMFSCSLIAIIAILERGLDQCVNKLELVYSNKYQFPSLLRCGHGIKQKLVQLPHILFTGLEDYKARGTQAAPYFTVTFYTDFAESKDLVLIRGEVVFTSKLSDSEAEWLLETTQSFYLNDVRYKLVEQFNKQTHDFEFKDVLRALNMPVL